MKKLLVSATAIGLLVAACGDADSALSGTTTTAVVITTTIVTTTTSTSTTTTTTPPPTTTTTVAHIDIPEGTGVVTVIPEMPAGTGGVAIDGDGNLYMADMGPGRTGHRVWKLTPDGSLSIYVDDATLLKGASGNAVDAEGNLYQSSYNTGLVIKVTPAGEMSVFADDQISGPIGVVANPAGGIFVADCSRGAVIAVDGEGAAEVFARSELFACPNGITMDEAGNLYVANFSDGKLLKVTPDAEVSELVELPGDNNGHLAFADGVLYVAARGANQIYEVTLEGEATVFAGTGAQGLDDGPVLEATLIFPNGVAVAPDGSIWINQPIVTNGDNRPVALRRISR